MNKYPKAVIGCTILGILAVLPRGVIGEAISRDLFHCTVKDVVEISPAGIVGRRPTLTQFEMALHPTFQVERSSGMLRSTRLSADTDWLLIQPGSDHDDLVTITRSEQTSGIAPAELVRIRASGGRETTSFLWLSHTTLRTGECRPE